MYSAMAAYDDVDYSLFGVAPVRPCRSRSPTSAPRHGAISTKKRDQRRARSLGSRAFVSGGMLDLALRDRRNAATVRASTTVGLSTFRAQ